MLTAILAYEKGTYAIGYQGKLPWKQIIEDASFFRDTTLSSIVVMGAKTFLTDLNKKPLGDRLNIVLVDRERVDTGVITDEQPELDVNAEFVSYSSECSNCGLLLVDKEHFKNMLISLSKSDLVDTLLNFFPKYKPENTEEIFLVGGAKTYKELETYTSKVLASELMFTEKAKPVQYDTAIDPFFHRSPWTCSKNIAHMYYSESNPDLYSLSIKSYVKYNVDSVGSYTGRF